MSDYTLRVKRFMNNALLQRKQFHLEMIHPAATAPTRTQIREQLAKLYKVNDVNRIIVYSFDTKFGGGRTIGMGKIYDSLAAAKKYEKRHYLARLGIAPTRADEAEAAGKPLVTRRAKKDIKTRRKKVRGTAKAKVSGGKK